MTPAWFLVALGLLGAQRIGELAYARRTARLLLSRGAVAVRPDGMAALVCVHVAFFAGCLAESWWAPWAGPAAATLSAGAVLFAAGEALRLGSMATLRWRWNTRVFVLPGRPLVKTGPYRFLRHPIYVGVVLELAGFALLDSLWFTAAAATGANLLALRRRIALEEAALRPAPGRAVPPSGLRDEL